MADRDFNKELVESGVYQIASKLGMDISAYKASTADELKNALDELKKAIQKRQQENDDEKNAADLKALEDKPELKEEYQNIQKEIEPKPEPQKEDRGSLTVSQTEQEETLDNSWIIETRQNHQQSADAKELAYQEVDPENLSKTSLEFELLKDGQSYGKLKYTARDHAQISADSKFEAYQGLVHDAIKKDLNIAADNSMTDAQKLMLYAAVLDSKETYKNGDKAQIMNPPAIEMEGEVFKSLPENVQAILKAEIERQKEAAKAKEIAARVAELRQIISTDDANHTKYKATLSKEQLEKREEKEAKREASRKVMAARMGIAGFEDVKDKDGKTVEKDEKFVAEHPELLKRLQDRYTSKGE